jgi:hypothetical protein
MENYSFLFETISSNEAVGEAKLLNCMFDGG